MDIKGILNKLGNCDFENLDFRFYFTQKVDNERYSSFSPSISKELSKSLINIIIKNISNIEGIEDMEQVNFNPVGHRDETLEIANIKDISNYNYIINSYEEKNVSRSIETKDIIKLSFYCFKIRFENDDEILFFRRVSKFKKLSKTGIMGYVKNNSFKQIDGNILGLDGDVDIIVYDNQLLILNHISLERIFSINDKYVEKAKTTLKIIKKSDRIYNFRQFEEDCMNDLRVIRMLTKLLNEETIIDNCFGEFKNVKQVISIFELEINIKKIKKGTENREMIVYENKEQLVDIIRIVRDSYYKSLIYGEAGIDDIKEHR